MSAVYVIEIELNDKDVEVAQKILKALSYGEELRRFEKVD